MCWLKRLAHGKHSSCEVPFPTAALQALALTFLPSNYSTMVPEIIIFLGLQDYRKGTRAGREAKTPRYPELGLNPASWSICQAPNPVFTYSPGLIITSSPREQASSSPCEGNEIFKWKRGDLLDDLLGRAPRDHEL